MQKKIQNIMDNFAFEKVHKYMVAVDWQWRANGVPTIENLREEARRLLESVSISKLENSQCSTGGFHALKWTWHPGEVELELIFEVESWDAT